MKSISMNSIIAAGVENSKEIFVNFNWMLTDLCNYKCAYCYAGYGHDTTRPVSKLHKPNIKTSWKSVLARLSLNVVPRFNLDLVGGEPTLHPDINKIITGALSIPNLNMLFLTTNLSKPIEFYTNLSSCDKMTINISYHSQYINKRTIDKILTLNKTHRVHVHIMLIDNDQFVEHVRELITIFENNDITYAGTYLFPTCTYKPKYTEKQLTEYGSLFTNKKEYRFKTKTVVLFQTSDQIITKKLNKFKNWRCSARSWEISTDGKIVNTCTRQPIDHLFKNTDNFVTCPQKRCECVSFWDYTKYENISDRI